MEASAATYHEIFSNFEGRKGDLIPILHEIQNRFGYVSEQSVAEISRFLKTSPNHIYGVASFYTRFRFTKPGRNLVKVCMGTACHVRGGQIISEAVERELGIHAGEITPDRRYEFERVACLGCCALAPVMQINEDIHGQVSVSRLKKILGKYE